MVVNMSRLQNIIISDIPQETLKTKWLSFDFKTFSRNKTLFDFQENALRNANKALHLFFIDKKGKKKYLYNHYKANGLNEDFDYDLKKKEGKQSAKYLLAYDKDYPVIDGKISFEHFINRMSFWMATGSGKTLVIVKLIELLSFLIYEKEIPQNDILFLAHRDDLLDQFKKHIDEFNSYHFGRRIVLKSLREYDSVKREIDLFKDNEITIFYYRSDLFYDETKEKKINFKNYDNDGKWYILLDEAHKGDREDSIRQIFYSILSRNGFLFNFSATFTDPRDYATCAFNFNLSKFIEEGYGKHIYISEQEITAFRDKDDFSPIEKQKIVLKTLFLLTYINKHYEKIKEHNLYHKPLLLTLVNSVNTEDSDLFLFFNELEKIAKNEIRQNLLDETKQEIIDEFDKRPKFIFEDIEISFDRQEFEQIKYEDILHSVFNSETPGNIEALKIPSNKQELVFKLATSDLPFALIKIGDITDWLKNKLSGYELIETWDNESVFKRLNQDDSSINILMGSRSFYEGWDSNRPNIVLFVNIGVGTDAKKFVLQSIGRGVRIEPLKNKRRRLLNLYNAKNIDEETYKKVSSYNLPLESLLVFGTNAENLKEIIKTLKEEKQDFDLGPEFIINKEAEQRTLLIPVYKDTDKIFAEEKYPKKYVISKEDYEYVKRYYNLIGEKIAVVKYDCHPKVLAKIQEAFNEPENFYNYDIEKSLYDPSLIFKRITEHFNLRDKVFDYFKPLKDEIVHFRKIKVTNAKKYNEILEHIRKVRNYDEKDEKEQEAKVNFSEHGDLDKLLEEMFKIREEYKQESKIDKLRIKHIQNHYYIPLILSDEEKIKYINHIINVPSEVKFIKDLEEHIKQSDNFFSKYDWWMFSKIDQTLDGIYIPYYNSENNNINRFFPDFIFWMQKGNEYNILFIDPKGSEYTDASRKIEGFSNIFENREFKHDVFDVKVILRLKARDLANVPNYNYKKYWFDNLNKLNIP